MGLYYSLRGKRILVPTKRWSGKKSNGIFNNNESGRIYYYDDEYTTTVIKRLVNLLDCHYQQVIHSDPRAGFLGDLPPFFFFRFFFNKKLKPHETPNLIFISPFLECLFFLLRSLFFVFP